jgi:adenylate kinase
MEVSTRETFNPTESRCSCEKCGQIFPLRYNPPPSPDSCGCGGTLGQRKNDNQQVVRKRNDEYLAKTALLLDYLGAKGLVKAVNGVGSLDDVTARTRTVIGAA